MLDQINKNILATITYYDGLEYPLSSFEVWKYLIRTDYYATGNEPLSVTLLEVTNRLQNKEMLIFVEQQNGFYFLKGQSHLVPKRIKASKITASKMKGLTNVVWFLRFVPYVKMIGLTGRLAMKNARLQSDWDFLIVTQYGKIWTGRTLVTILVHLLGKRRHSNKVKDRACLNFFVTDQSLEVITKDLFSASEYTFLIPMYGWQTYTRFQIKNQWIKNMKPAYALDEIAPLKLLSDSSFSLLIKRCLEKILAPDFFESTLRKIEKKKILKNPKTHKEGSLIYANDDALVFLPSPHGPKIFEQFKEKINQLGI